MNTRQLDTLLRQDPAVGPVFRGVHPIDRLPKLKKGAYVINTAPSTHPGQHWVAVYGEDTKMDYFDSYGRYPPKTIRR